MKKRIKSLFLALLLCLGLATPVLAEDRGGTVGEFQTVCINIIKKYGCSIYMVIDDDGTLWGWEIDGSKFASEDRRHSNPVRILDNVASVSCWFRHYAAIKTDGTLWTWGAGECNEELLSDYRKKFNILSENWYDMALKPNLKKVLDDVAAVSVGENYTMAIKTDGTLWAWGSNEDGQLGNGSFEDCSTPVKVMDDVLSVYTDGSANFAIKTDHTLWAWGTGYLGDGLSGRRNTPVKVMDDVLTVSTAKLLSSRRTTMAIKTDGTLWAWGFNGISDTNHGFLGFSGGDYNTYNPNSASPFEYYQTVPRQVYGIDNVVAIRNGGTQFMALKSDGTLWSWGVDESVGVWDGKKFVSSCLGYKSTNSGYFLPKTDTEYRSMQTTPKQVTDHVSAMSFGMVLKTDGTLWAWGDNNRIDDGDEMGPLGFQGGDVFFQRINSFTDSAWIGRCYQCVPKKIEQIDDVVELFGTKKDEWVSGNLVCKSDGTLWQLIRGDFVPIELNDFVVSEDGTLSAYIGHDRDVIIPDKVTAIGKSAFSGNTDVASVTIPKWVSEIGAGAFSGCTSLTSVTIPDGVTKIGEGAFEGCQSLTSVTIPDGVTKIEAKTFSGCTGLTSVTIPNSVTKIEPDGFEDCTSLIDVTAPKNSDVTDGVFDQTPYQKRIEVRHTMMVTLSVVAVVAVVILIMILEMQKRKKNPELYAQKKLEQEKRREEKRAEQAAAEKARIAKLAAEEEAKRKQQAAAQAKRRIEEVLAGTVACSCGTVNPATAQFCSGCGKPVKVPGRCVCGHQNDPEAKFCQGCGKPLDGGEG